MNKYQLGLSGQGSFPLLRCCHVSCPCSVFTLLRGRWCHLWWHCTQCKDTDLCQSCHHAFLTEGKHHDTDHIFTQQSAAGGVHAHNTDPGKSSDWEPYSVPHLAKDPVHVPDVELPSEDIMTLLENPPQMGVVRVFLDPVAHQLDWLDTSVIVRQGVATGTGPLGGFHWAK